MELVGSYLEKVPMGIGRDPDVNVVTGVWVVFKEGEMGVVFEYPLYGDVVYRGDGSPSIHVAKMQADGRHYLEMKFPLVDPYKVLGVNVTLGKEAQELPPQTLIVRVPIIEVHLVYTDSGGIGKFSDDNSLGVFPGMLSLSVVTPQDRWGLSLYFDDNVGEGSISQEENGYNNQGGEIPPLTSILKRDLTWAQQVMDVFSRELGEYIKRHKNTGLSSDADRCPLSPVKILNELLYAVRG